MSGDVQPRKRREKKKKKEDAPEEVVFQQHSHHTVASPNVTDDLNIHVQKEASTGGGLCAKCVFFILLTILTAVIGLIITEHRGLTDLDSIGKESRFAQIFEGWIDTSPATHESEEHFIDESEEEIYDDEEDDDNEETEEKSNEDAEEENENDEDESEDEDTMEETIEDTGENDTGELSNETEQDEDNEQDEYEEDQDYASKENEQEDISEEEERNERSLDTKEEDDDNDDEEETSAITLSQFEYDKDDVDDADEHNDQSRYIKKADLSKSGETVSLNSIDEDVSKMEITKEEEEEDEDEDDDDDEEDSFKENYQKASSEKLHVTNEDQPEETVNSNMVVKFGVGTALLVVAHVVLIQKWRTGTVVADKKPPSSTEEKESITPDLSRRNTIVSPPSLEEIEQDIENIEEEYSGDEEDYDSEEENKSKPVGAKKRYQELQSTYSHSLSPTWEPKELREKLHEKYEEEAEEEEEEEEEDEREDDDYDDEISENEDAELLKRLETKYGKLRQSDEEVDDNDYEDEEQEEDDEEDEDEEGRYTKDEDYGFWKRVKAPSADEVVEDDSENEKNWSKQGSGPQAVYEFENITNADDWSIREELDDAHQNLLEDTAYALILFNKILERRPSSPRALYGKAQSLDILAEKKKSNALLQEAISFYQFITTLQEVPDALFQMAAERCINRMRFRGLYNQAVVMHKTLIGKFPQIAKFSNDLAVTYLSMNRVEEARSILTKTLAKWPNDGFALVHYGFILKTVDNSLRTAVKYLRKGIATKEPGVTDGRFYFHLGDALTRLGKRIEAMDIYADGVKNKVFLSKYQRSLYNVNRLTSKPWWRKKDFPYSKSFKNLENIWELIRDEGLNVLNKDGYFKPESENLRDVGDWKQFELYARGIKNVENCKQCPVTCKVVETLPDAISCRRGQIKFSVMHPGTHVWPHCGPTNCRLRIHLGLKVPLNTYIRVGEEIRTWENGKLLIFDDSFEHEVWHNGADTRLVLIIDVWHPELTKEEKQRLSSI